MIDRLHRKALILGLLILMSLGAAAHAHAATAGRIHISNNWSGYAATDGSYTGVSAAWTVPSSTQTDRTVSADAAWVGIGGISDQDLIQAGTQAVILDGHTQYTAWYELLPDTQQTVPLPLHPGDRVSTSVNEIAPGIWRITIANLTTQQTYQNTVAYDSSHSSAEWVVERPLAITETATGYLPLSDFGDLSFDDATFTTPAGTHTLSNADAEQLIMGGSGTRLLASPKEADAGSFTVSYLSSSESARLYRALRRAYTLEPQENGSTGPQHYEQINTGYIVRIIFSSGR